MKLVYGTGIWNWYMELVYCCAVQLKVQVVAVYT